MTLAREAGDDVIFVADDGSWLAIEDITLAELEDGFAGLGG